MGSTMDTFFDECIVGGFPLLVVVSVSAVSHPSKLITMSNEHECASAVQPTTSNLC